MEDSFFQLSSHFPVAKTFVTELVANHDFQSKRLFGKTCELCKQNISIFQSGLQCGGCNFITHKTCLTSVTNFPKECRIRSDVLIWSHANQPNPILRSSSLSDSPTNLPSMKGISRPRINIASEFSRDDHVMHVGFSKLDRSFIAINDCGLAVEVNIEMYFSDEEIIVSPLPPPLTSKRVLQVCTGAAHTMLLLQTGHVYAWGSNAKGQLGVGANIGHCSLPCLLYTFYDKGQIIDKIATGGYHSAAVSYHNQVYTWGLGENGRLGHGNESTEYLPKTVATLSRGNMVVSRMSCGWDHTLVLVSRKLSPFEVDKNNNNETPKTPGNKINLQASVNVSNDSTVLVSEVFSFGKGDFGQCGHGTFDDCLTPKAIEALKDSHVVDIDGGFNHSVCLTGPGDVYCWGFGGEGQCGNGEKRNTNVPFQVALPSECSSIFAGAFHNMAVTRNNEIFVWGRLGNNQNHLRPCLIDAVTNRTIIQAACGMLATVLVTVENSDTPPSSLTNTMASLPYPQRIRLTKLMELSWNQLLQLQITDDNFYIKGGANYKLVKRRVRKGVPPTCRKRVWMSLSGGLQLMSRDPYLYWGAMKAIFARRTLLKSYDDNGVSKLADANLIFSPSKPKLKDNNTQPSNDNNQPQVSAPSHPLQTDSLAASNSNSSTRVNSQLALITEESIDSYRDSDKEKYFKLVFDYSHKEQGHKEQNHQEPGQTSKAMEESASQLAQLIPAESEFTVRYELLQNFIIDDFVFDSHKLNENDIERAKRILWVLFRKDAPDFAFLQVTLPALVCGLLHFLSEDQVYFCAHSLVKKPHFEQYRKIDPQLYTWVLLLLLKKECPDLFAHITTFMAEEMLSEEHYANSWHNGFFVGKLQYKFVMTIIDQFMVQGYKVLYRLGVAIFMHNAPEIFKCSTKYQLFETLDKAMQSYDDTLFNELLQTSYTLDISHSIIWSAFMTCRDSILPIFQKSTIVNWEQFATIWMWLPARYKLCTPKKLFCSSQDGFNLNSLINKCGYSVPTLMIVKSDSQRCFGAFINCEWDRSTDYRGSGEMFIFTLMPEPKKFPWTRENNNFIRVDNKCLMIGGGGAGCALWLDDELYRGWSVHSATFDNDPLNVEKDFQCVEVEVFALIET